MTAPTPQPFAALGRGLANALCQEHGIRLILQPGANPQANLTERTLTLPPPVSLSPQDLQVWHGMVDHEVGHLLLTDPDTDTTLALNILEDCRINHIMAQRYLGSGSNIAALYRHSASQPIPPGAAADPRRAARWGVLRGLMPHHVPPLPADAHHRGAEAKAWGRAHAGAVTSAPDTASLLPLAAELAKLLDEEEQSESAPLPWENPSEHIPTGAGTGTVLATRIVALPQSQRNRFDTADARATLAAAIRLGQGLAAEARQAVLAATFRGRARRQRTGSRLDAGAFPAIVAGDRDPRPWQRKGAPLTDPDTAVGIVVDGSGSMTNCDRVIPALSALSALVTALAGVPRVQLAAWTNWATDGDPDEGEDVTQYLAQLLPWGGRITPARQAEWAKGAMKGGVESWAPLTSHLTPQLLARHARRRLLVLITDGEMDDNDKTHLPTAAQAAEAAGVEVYVIAFGAAAKKAADVLPPHRSFISPAEDPSREWIRTILRVLKGH